MPLKHVMLATSGIIEGGSEEVILNLARGLDSDQYRVHVATFLDGPMTRIFYEQGINYLSIRGESEEEKLQKLRYAISTLNIDYVFCNYLHLAHLYTPPNVRSIEIVHALYPWLRGNNEYTQALHKAAKVVCVSGMVEAYMMDHYPQIRHKLVTIDNGIDPTKLQTTITPEEMRQRLNIPANGVVIGNLGRITPEKGIERMLEIAKILHTRYENLYFVIPGNPERNPAYWARIQQQIAAEKIPRIIFPGFIETVGDLLQIYDVFAFTSYHDEGFALALVEALKMGRPVVTTYVGVAIFDPDLRDRDTAFVVKDYSDQAFSERVAELIDHPEERQRLAARGKAVFASKYLVTDMLRAYKQILQEIL